MYLYLPFILQGILMGIDENIHEKRGLGLWERLGHPLDTLTVCVPMSYIALNDFTDSSLTVFIILAIFSCLFITKDEFVHSKECSAFENWLHAVLFVLHPIIFLCAGIIWKSVPDSPFLMIQPILIGVFMIYQLIRWSFPWKQRMQ
jgi:hypothetical protein